MRRRDFLLGIAGLAATSQARAQDANPPPAPRGLLKRCALAALGPLGAEAGFYGDPRVRIGLHRNLARAEGLLRGMGHGRRLDELVLAMNRTAELAIAPLTPVVMQALDGMEEGEAVPAGEGAYLTARFRQLSEAALAVRLQPIVHEAAVKAELIPAYNALARALSQWGVRSDIATVEAYVNRKTLDGIFLRMADEERALRAPPAPEPGGATHPEIDSSQRSTP